MDIPDGAEAKAVRSVATSDIPALDASVFTEASEVYDVATLEQRFKNLATQPQQAADLVPMPKALLAKRSKRCRECQHNMIKPELSPVSIKFKMKFFAVLSVPEVRVVSLPEGLTFGKPCPVIVTIANPLDHAIDVLLNKEGLPLPPSIRPQPAEGAEAAAGPEAVALAGLRTATSPPARCATRRTCTPSRLPETPQWTCRPSHCTLPSTIPCSCLAAR